jgi:pre-mRNA-splicing helicase BRR2
MADQSQYKYSNMSNLVLQVDKRFVHRRTDEATGDPESLAGRVNVRQMGDRALRDDAPKEMLIKKKKRQQKEKDIDVIEEGRDERRKRRREYVTF